MEQAKTTQEIANRYYELAQQGKWMDIQNELYAADIINREPEHAVSMGIPTFTQGLEAIRAKAKARMEQIEAVHRQYCGKPVIGGNCFSLMMGRDLTLKGKALMNVEEIGVFQVKDGKIVLEQFFY